MGIVWLVGCEWMCLGVGCGYKDGLLFFYEYEIVGWYCELVLLWDVRDCYCGLVWWDEIISVEFGVGLSFIDKCC